MADLQQLMALQGEQQKLQQSAALHPAMLEESRERSEQMRAVRDRWPFEQEMSLAQYGLSQDQMGEQQHQFDEQFRQRIAEFVWEQQRQKQEWPVKAAAMQALTGQRDMDIESEALIREMIKRYAEGATEPPPFQGDPAGLQRIMQQPTR